MIAQLPGRATLATEIRVLLEGLECVLMLAGIICKHDCRTAQMPASTAFVVLLAALYLSRDVSDRG